MSNETYTTAEGDTVDLIAWRRLGRTESVTEQILAANPGLAEYGPLLPAGLKVAVPATPAKKTVRSVPRIWS